MKNIITSIEPKNKLFLDTITSGFLNNIGYSIILFDSASELINVRLNGGMVAYVSSGSSISFEEKKFDYGAMREIADKIEYYRKKRARS